MNGSTRFAALLLVLVSSYACTVNASPSVDGKLVTKSGTSILTHAYSFWKDQAPFREGQDFYVLLSDVAIDTASLPRNDDGSEKMASLVREGKVHALELHFAKVGESLNDAEQGAIYDNAIAPARRGLNGMLIYQRFAADGKTISGKITTTGGSLERNGFSITGSFKIDDPSQ